ncbi:MAG TPA: N-acetylmuramoyl-L-alanine amidase [Vicinamibacterales bacterium]|nr:N-acetylmuramoyl-L-alanine amidase [Vicinamibacterales bacterium]
MRNFARRCARVLVTATAAWLTVGQLAAQTGTAQTAKQRFEAAQERDEKVRVLLTNVTSTTPPSDLVVQVKQVMSSFESIVRRFPTSGYADNALWQAASLADAAYQRLNRQEDRDRAVRLYRWLVQEYPSSSFVKQANAKIVSLGNTTMPTIAPAPVALTNAPLAAAAAPIPSPDRATLTSIQRAVLPNTVRVTIELDKEVVYREERLAGPSRLFFDLKNVQLTPALMDKVLTYGSDIVGKIRVGRHPDNTVRVVLDFEDVAKYSVFTLYSPFRLVIDAERVAGRIASTPTNVIPVTSPMAAPAPALPVRPVEIREDMIAPPVVVDAVTAPAPLPPPLPSAPVLQPTTPATNAAGGFSIARQLGLSVSRIVIDPGHGGRDPGTIAKGLSEAALTLDVALRLEKLLQKELGIEVVLTRRTDVYVPLEERTAIANRHNADLFLSIHANSSRVSDAKGVETYFLSFASSPEAEAVAARENSASEREMHQLPDIIKAIALNNKLDESRDLANMVQDSLVTNLKKSNKDVRSRGVKKAPFVVLIGAAMPSVLAEISFITNKQELQLLKTPSYKDKIAQSLYAAVLRYRRSLKGAAATTVER